MLTLIRRHIMDLVDPLPDVTSDHRKSKIWNRLKRQNSSTPSLHKIGVKNWSTRSLPRFGSFGSSNIATSPHTPSPKSSSPVSPFDGTFCFPQDIEPPKPLVAKDYFSALPNEVKLQIFSHLPLKAIARAAAVPNLPLFHMSLMLLLGLQTMAVIMFRRYVIYHDRYPDILQEYRFPSASFHDDLRWTLPSALESSGLRPTLFK